MKKFELWLDESGDFDNDAQKARNGAKPSLVGGLLVENNTFPASCINAILPEAGTYHSVNERDQLERFRLMEEKLYQNESNRIVVFSNQECIMILDNHLTYLNIICEGILHLLRRLKAQYGEIFLKVVIANRVDTTTGLNPAQSVVQTEEYEKRVREKLLVAGLENAVSDREWELQTASARRDKRLMLADIVCNTYFTRYRRKKFNAEEQAYIESLYSDERKTLVFTVFESVLEKNFKNYLMENRIGEAVSGICLSSDKAVIERGFALLKLKFSACGIHDIVFQYKFIAAYIEYYINVVREYDVCVRFLRNLLDYYIPLLREYDGNGEGDLAGRLALDIKFYLLTVYTHLGNIELADKTEAECEEEIRRLPRSLETAGYQIKFETRRIINFINAFDFETALAYADGLVEKCKVMKELLDLLSEDKIGYDEELAKALGTRLQIRTFMLREKRSDYDECVKDSEAAIHEFVRDSDKRRQYLYRVSLETEHGDYDEALRYLKKAVSLKEDASVKALWNAAAQNSLYEVSAYIRLMSEGAVKWSTTEEMYRVLSESGYLQRLEEKAGRFHPWEIMLWKLGSYCGQNGMINAAVKYYEKAVEVCFADENRTLHIIGLGIGFEERALLLGLSRKEAVSRGRFLQKKWNQVKASDAGYILQRVFGEVDFQNGSYEYYRKLGRKITY